MVDYGLRGKVALITGVNNPQGIGATTALAFAREGAKLVLVYKKIDREFDKEKIGKNGVDRYYAANAGDASFVENRLREMQADFMILESDIADENAVKKIYEAALERFGRVDILVNNAATDDENGQDTIERITQKVIDDTFAVNVRGSILMIRELARHHGDYGRVINLSTDAAQVFAGQITYGASKATLEEPGEIISRETIETSIDGGEAYRILMNDEKVGGVIVKVDGERGDLDILFVSPYIHSKGIGYAAWCAVEKLHPEVTVWETVTPYFEQRNIHFYVNCCGFHIVEFYNSHHPNPNDPDAARELDE